MGRGKKQGRSSGVPRANDQRETILNFRAEGVSPDAIARALHLEVAHVEQVLAGGSQDGAASSQAVNDEAVVRRLMKDPEELCCPLSYELMEDPVVAADGFTYERSWVEEQFRRVPGKSPMTGLPMSTTVLHPNLDKKASILTFKEETVKEILSVVPTLASQQSLELLKRGEGFVRPLLPDASASKKLASLLLLRMKLPGTDHDDIAKEAVSLLLALQDEAFMREAFLDMKESDLLALLPSLDEESVSKLHGAMSSWNALRKGLVDREQARRLASRLNEDRLRSLWQLIQASLTDDRAWVQAAACLLSGHLNRLEVDLSDLSAELLMEATRFLDDQDAAIAFAKDFFDYDLGISACDLWPQKCTASIFLELAHRLADDKSDERLQMLLKGHGIDESHVTIQNSLAQQLQHEILSQETNNGFERQGLFLKLALKEGHNLPVDLLLKLSIEERHLGQTSADQLMILSEQLGQHDRSVDAAQVTVVAAKAFKSTGEVRLSEEAFLKAFNLNPSNRDAARGVAGAVASAHGRCQEVEEQCQQLKESSMELQQRCQQLEESHQQLEKDGQRTEQDRKALEKRCKELEKSRKELEERCRKLERQPQLEATSPSSALLSVVWDLSGYDFSGFQNGQEQLSERFQLPGGVNAWMALYPKGHSNSDEGKAGLFLCVDKPALVKWTWQSGSSMAWTWTWERDFSQNDLMPDGTPAGWGHSNFMRISQTKGRITLRILSVQLPNSSLCFS